MSKPTNDSRCGKRPERRFGWAKIGHADVR